MGRHLETSSPLECSLLGNFYVAHQRHTVIKGVLDPDPWQVSAGLLQGCPLSILCAVATVATWHETIPQEVTAQSYVDDRILLSPTKEALSEAWNASELWNAQNGWLVNQEKSHCFASSPHLLGDLPLHVEDSFGYLGHDIRTNHSASRTTIGKRANNAAHSAERISQLPVKIPIGTRKSLIATVVAPRWAYGILGAPPSKLMVQQLDRHIKRAMWSRQKAFHSWPMATALIYPPQQVGAWAMQVYCHLRGCLQAFSRRVTDVQTELWNGPPPIRPSGPIHTLHHFLRQMGCIVLPNFWVNDGTQDIHLVHSARSFLKQVPHLLTRTILRSLVDKRPQFRDYLRADILVTWRLLNNPRFQYFSELLCVITDGLWTGHRLVHTQHATTAACWWCGYERQDALHLYWHCPHWQAQQPALLPAHKRLIMESPTASSCGICLIEYPPELKQNWSQVQLHMCRVVRACNEWFDTRVKEKRTQTSQGPPPPSSEPLLTELAASVGEAAPQGDVFPPLPPAEVWQRSRPVDFTSLTGRKSQGVVWQFTHAQWNRLQNYMTGVRVPERGDQDRVPRVSVLEMYASYIMANGGHRFHTGITKEARGEWITSDLELFGHALQSFQAISCFDDLVFGPGEHGKVEKWSTARLPPSQSLKMKVLLPHWRATRLMLVDLLTQVPPISGDETLHAEMWRRLSFGKAGTQMQGQGALPATALVWRPLRRIRYKEQIPTWAREGAETRGFRGWVARQTVSQTMIDGKTFLQILQEQGVASTAMLGRFRQAQQQQLKRTNKFIEHALRARAKSQHATTVLAIGERPQCVACQKIGALSKAFNWLQTRCDSIRTYDMTSPIAQMHAQKTQTLLILRILSKLQP